MFAHSYWTSSYFTPPYWPPVEEAAPIPPVPLPLPLPTFRVYPSIGRVIWEPKLQGESRNYAFDLTSIFEAGKSVTSIQVLAVVYSGDDDNPQLIVNGIPMIQGTQVIQNFTGGVTGTVYEVACVFRTGSEVLMQAAYLAVIQDVT
jgi:hypothetical protein